MFSWDKARQWAITEKTNRAKLMAGGFAKQLDKNGNPKDVARIPHPDFQKQHPGEVTDATAKNYTKLVARVKTEVEAKQQAAIDRRNKIGTRNKN